MTPLHVAAEKGECLDVVEYLIDEGANINIKDYNGVSETMLILQIVLYSLFILLFEKFYYSSSGEADESQLKHSYHQK